VKALTGVDTDRWEEEKRRGITIDLGFAPLALEGMDASIVDVPGHEGFVRNMLAGATGIDVALLVIAADEGIMPQTEEHLAIVELLGVRRGIPVITKRDLVDDEWLELVRAEVRERLARSRAQWAEPVFTSVQEGSGIAELRAALQRVAGDLIERPLHDHFRLPIDRVFAVAGAGTVVTGSTWTGSVAIGESVRLLPLDREARVRSIEVHGRPAERAMPGRRTALALVGVDKSEVGRGHVALTGGGWRATSVFDAMIELLPSVRKPLASRTRVRVHLGTAEVLGRVVQLPELKPGATGIARFVLEHPLVARAGDRFVVRSFSPVSTIGGGSVLDPFPPRRPARLRQRRLAAHQTPQERLIAWVEEAGLGGVPVEALPVRLGVEPAFVENVITQAGKALLVTAQTIVLRAVVAAVAEGLGPTVERYHREHPLDPGMSLQALRATVSGSAGGGGAGGKRGGGGDRAASETAPNAAVVDLVLEFGVRKRAIEIDGGVARRPAWRPEFDAGTGDARTRLEQRIVDARWQIPTLAELERDFPDVPVRALLAHLVRGGEVERVDQERFAAKRALDEFRKVLEAALREAGPQTPAQLRDRFGLTRKYLIPLLEWADRRGITTRQGDARTLLA
jgi:selenocysteine-specific elongation factor